MFLACGRTTGHKEKTHACTGWTCKDHKDRPQSPAVAAIAAATCHEWDVQAIAFLKHKHTAHLLQCHHFRLKYYNENRWCNIASCCAQ